MNSSISSSDSAGAYDRLHPKVQQWIRGQGWSQLRPVQVAAANAILGGEGDVLISASTAAGKTEAAFLPILTLVAERKRPGLSVLYVSPLKALINDQFSRLGLLCEHLELPIVRWHGDASQSAKSRMTKDPKGIALITPESIEAMFARRPADVVKLLCALDFVVIDEVHAFMQGPRGLHLSSLLKRIDAASQQRARRIGLSATIGDLDVAAGWLRPTEPATVKVLNDPGEGLDLQLQIRGYVDKAPEKSSKVEAPHQQEGDADVEVNPTSAMQEIAEHLFGVLRGSNNLVFGGSRRTVETLADALRSKSERVGVPNEFYAHHGNLSKELREELESRLKSGDLPTTAVCTTTLELGIDIGSVKSIAQIDAPRSISSLRQRLGRTGRREGIPSILRIYVAERECDQNSNLLDELRPNVVRAVAAIRLLARRFVEPASSSSALATALLHQTLSVIAERGGAKADAIFKLLGGPGPFAAVTPKDYIDLLRHAASPEMSILEQAPDGTLMLGKQGERLVLARDFFAMFQGDQEWRLALGSKTLGTIPLSNPVAKGNLIVFAGRRWQIVDVDERAHVLAVAPHRGGRIPKFEGASAEETHDALLLEMRRVYESDDVPTYLDEPAKALLSQARAAYRRSDLARVNILDAGSAVHLFPWVGSAAASVIAVALALLGVTAEANGLSVVLPGVGMDDAKKALAKLASSAPEDLARIEEHALGLCNAKYDEYVPDALLRRLWGRRNAKAISAIPGTARQLATNTVTH
jgi:ATP-dependent Lhr-like helicase